MIYKLKLKVSKHYNIPVKNWAGTFSGSNHMQMPGNIRQVSHAATTV